MEQNQEEIQQIVDANERLSSNFSVWPIIMFFLGLIIAALSYNFTIH